jgi:hypothetical protein
MAEAIVITSRILTPEEAEARRKRMAALIEEVELELLEMEENKVAEKSIRL